MRGETHTDTRMKAYILVEARMGKAGAIASAVHALELPRGTLLSADVVTGPFDLIAAVETSDLETLMASVTDRIQEIDGVLRTITCVGGKPVA
ncbi:MAG: Lrp/AsnC family transcriptional regulator [Chloroflexi bacterium]|nr:MAG: Lrp/AsnC family transcriptional regulator [Chloroflexota bacterium]